MRHYISISQVPSTPDQWKQEAGRFERRWNFPHCVRSINDKHIPITAPSNSGSYFFIYKGTYSVLLMAVVDLNKEFIYVNVGRNGRVADGGVWGNCSLANLINNNDTILPPRRTCPGQCSAETSFHTANGENNEIMMIPLQRLQRRPTYESRETSEGFRR